MGIRWRLVMFDPLGGQVLFELGCVELSALVGANDFDSTVKLILDE